MLIGDKIIAQTKVIPNTLNPIWDDAKFVYPVLHLNSKVCLKLFDQDSSGSEFLGQVWIDMSALPREPSQSISLPVERGESTYKAQGKITFNAYIEVSLLHLFIICLASI